MRKLNALVCFGTPKWQLTLPVSTRITIFDSPIDSLIYLLFSIVFHSNLYNIIISNSLVK